MTSQSDESDEKRNPYMRLWIDDARSSCHVMSAAQFGAHMRMLMYGWERGYVPADERVLRRIVGDIDWTEMREVLDRWQAVTLEDGTAGWINRRQERERERMTKEASRRREAGRKGADSRWDGKRDGNRHGKDHGTIMAFPESQSPTVPESQTPISQNPPLSSDGDKAPSKRGKRKPSSDPLRWTEPDGWVGVVDADHEAWGELYPAVDSRYELKRLDRWLRDNPTKAHKSHWRRWLNKLFGIKQDKGGSAAGTRVELVAAGSRRLRDESHIPDDCHPDDRHRWFEGNFPTTPVTYHNLAGEVCSGPTRKVI